MLIFSLASVVAELSAILWFFTKQKLQNIAGTNAATCQKIMAADVPSYPPQSVADAIRAIGENVLDTYAGKQPS